VNNADILFAAGWFGVYPNVPSDLGAEGVGRVVTVGAGVDESLIGRRVLVLPTFEYGTWAQETVVPANQLIPVPEDVDALQLAMLPVNAATAYALLHDFVALSPGDWIGLNLANSAVGHYLIPLAKRAGIKTLAVVRRESAAEQVRPLGADVVLVDGDHTYEGVLGDVDHWLPSLVPGGHLLLHDGFRPDPPRPWSDPWKVEGVRRACAELVDDPRVTLAGRAATLADFVVAGA
jgi:NADPH:quinone reductase-like Zn-dependent oxidoreductase